MVARHFEAQVSTTLVSTSASTLDVTVSGKGTPVGFLVLGSRHRVVDSNLDDITLSWGVGDGTNEYAVGYWSQDASASANSGQTRSATRCVYLPDPDDDGASALMELSFNSWITDGVRFDIDTNPTTTIPIIVVLFYGDGTQAFAFSADAPGATSPTTVTTGFEVDCGFTVNMHGSTDEEAEMKMQFGVFTQSDQGVSVMLVNDGTANGQSVRGYFNDRISIQHDHSSNPGSIDGANIVDNFTSTGFDISEFSAGVGPGDRTIGLALNVGGANVHVETGATTSTSVTSKAYNEAGFYPEFVYVPVGNAAAAGSLLTVGNMSLAFFDGANLDVAAFSAREENGSANTDNDDRLAANKVVHLRNHASGATIISAEIDELTASGFTLDYTDVVSPDRDFAYLAIQKITDGEGDGTLLITGSGSGTVQDQKISGFTFGTSTTTASIGAAVTLSPIDGSTAGAATTTATLSATAAIDGSAAGSATTDGILVGAGVLDGSAAGAATATATLAGAATLDGSAAGAATTDGALVGTGALAGSADGAATTEGAVAAPGVLDGSAAGLASTDAALVGTGALSASAAGLAATTAALAAAAALTGTAEGTSALTASLSASAALGGSSAGLAAAAATASGRGALSGSAAGAASTSAAVGSPGALSANVSGSSTAAASILGSGTVAGESAGAATTDGALVGTGALAGTIAGTSTTSATLAPLGDLGGTVSGTSTTTATLSATAALDGSVQASARPTPRATLVGIGALDGTSAGSSTATATGRLLGRLAGSIAGAATLPAFRLAATVALSVSIAATATAAATLAATAALDGSAAGVATATATGSGAPVAEVVEIVTLAGSRDVVATLVGARSINASLVGARCVNVNLLGTRSLST